MILYPAIDLKDGKAVRLLRGDMAAATVFNEDPADQARQFVQAGFQWLHLVDLDGAFAGKPENAEAVRAILDAVDLPVQLGGGIRDLATIEGWLEAGVSRVILGTAAVRDPDLVREACGLFPDQIAVGIDARGERVAVSGWAEESEMRVDELARAFEDAGVAAVIYTDIARDGALEGLNIERTLALAQSISRPVIASGGLKGIEDIEALLAAPGRGAAGVICGRALYDGRLDPKAALALVAEAALQC